MTREKAIKVLRTESIELGGNAVSVCRFWEALDMAIAALREQEGKDTNAHTNADHIRSMADEELADFLNQWGTSTRAWQKAPGETLYWLQQPAEEDDMTDCKHEFVYDELHGEIVCKFCGYVLTADDKRELHRKAFELMEEEEGAD